MTRYVFDANPETWTDMQPLSVCKHINTLAGNGHLFVEFCSSPITIAKTLSDFEQQVSARYWT